MSHKVLLFYKYITIENPETLMVDIKRACQKYALKGRVLVASEGINGTLEGLHADTEAFATWLLQDARFADMDIKRSEGDGTSFPKLSVKVRDEIVGTRFPKDRINPSIKTAPRLKADELREWYETKKDFVIVDMRNGYGIESGRFVGSVDPGLAHSRDLPQAIEKLAPLKDKTVVTVCTGGVRCEKMSAYLLDQGFENVYQLENGIHTYMEKYPGKDFLGTLYTFDNRKTMHFGGSREIIGSCKLCGSKTERYVNCLDDVCAKQFMACETCAPQDRVIGCSAKCSSVLRVQ